MFQSYVTSSDYYRTLMKPIAEPLEGPFQDVPRETNFITIEEKLINLTKKTQYSLVQRNGQRIYGGPPPGWIGKPPEQGTEVFVGKVPRDCYEYELVPIFEQVGPIYELRLMMDFSGSNRGYLFVRYTTRDHARMAVQLLNNFEIRPGKFLGVVCSVDNRRLWISGIPKDRSADEIKEELKRITDGVHEVFLIAKTSDYVFVEYETHHDAALARRRLIPGHHFLFGQEIQRVDWATPKKDADMVFNHQDIDTSNRSGLGNFSNTFSSTTRIISRDMFVPTMIRPTVIPPLNVNRYPDRVNAVSYSHFPAY